MTESSIMHLYDGRPADDRNYKSSYV